MSKKRALKDLTNSEAGGLLEADAGNAARRSKTFAAASQGQVRLPCPPLRARSPTRLDLIPLPPSTPSSQQQQPMVVIDLTKSTSVQKPKRPRGVDSWTESEEDSSGWVHHVIKSNLKWGSAGASSSQGNVSSAASSAASSASSSSSASASASASAASPGSSAAARANSDVVNRGISLRVRSNAPPAKTTCRVARTLPLQSKGTDPKLCLDRIAEMYEVFYELEESPGVSPQYGYMERQKDINQRMRSILVDWLVEVHHKFKLETITLWLCINIMDRYLELEEVKRSELQLVGVTALLIACKFEEIYPPEVRCRCRLPILFSPPPPLTPTPPPNSPTRRSESACTSPTTRTRRTRCW